MHMDLQLGVLQREVAHENDDLLEADSVVNATDPKTHCIGTHTSSNPMEEKAHSK